jgi:hypothetical protein
MFFNKNNVVGSTGLVGLLHLVTNFKGRTKTSKEKEEEGVKPNLV